LDGGDEAEARSHPKPAHDVCTTGLIGATIPCPFFPSPPLVYPIFLSNRDPIPVVRFSKQGVTKACDESLSSTSSF